VYAYSLDYITQNSLFTLNLQTYVFQPQTPSPPRSFIHRDNDSP